MKTVPPIQKQDTLAEGIAIAEPIRGPQILKAVENSGGAFLEVEEEEIKEALIELARKGFYVEPTAAATIAAIPKYLEPAEERRDHRLRSDRARLEVNGKNAENPGAKST